MTATLQRTQTKDVPTGETGNPGSMVLVDCRMSNSLREHSVSISERG